MNKVLPKVIKITGISISLVFSCFAADEQPPQQYSISGQWSLYEKRSDEVHKKLSRALEFFNPAKLRLVRADNKIYALGDFIEEPTSARVEQLYRYFDNIVPLVPIKFTIHQEPLFTIQYIDGRTRTVYTDGRAIGDNVQTTAVDDDQHTVFSAWEKRRLFIETNTLSGAHVEESYALVRDGKKILLQSMHTIQTSKLDKPLVIVRHYLHRQHAVDK